MLTENHSITKDIPEENQLKVSVSWLLLVFLLQNYENC